MLRHLFVALALVVLAPGRAHALGDAALIYVAPSSLTVSYGGLEAALRDAGATTVDVTSSWAGGEDLAARYRLVVVTPYEGPLHPSLGDDLAAFVGAGGGLVLITEHLGGAEAGNELASRRGIGARFGLSDTGPGCGSTATSAPDHPLTAGAPTLDFGWSAVVEGGTLLYGTTAPVVTVEGTVVLAGDSDSFHDGTGLGSCGVGPSTQRFYRNLFTSLADEAVGPGEDDGGTVLADGGVAGGGLGASCTTDADCASGPCATVGARSYCTQVCTDACPSGYRCESAGSVSVCTVASGGGCTAHPGRAGWIGPLLVAALAALGRLRRARRS